MLASSALLSLLPLLPSSSSYLEPGSAMGLLLLLLLLLLLWLRLFMPKKEDPMDVAASKALAESEGGEGCTGRSRDFCWRWCVVAEEEGGELLLGGVEVLLVVVSNGSEQW